MALQACAVSEKTGSVGLENLKQSHGTKKGAYAAPQSGFCAAVYSGSGSDELTVSAKTSISSTRCNPLGSLLPRRPRSP